MANTFRYTRSILVHASIEAIAPEIADLERHEAWSPFSRPDPKTTGAYAGRPGVGQSRTFAGGRSGAGRISIDAVEPHRISMTLAMTRPVKATNTVEYTLAPEAGATRVSWTMSGPMTLFGRLMGLFIDCEKMCGRMFDQGLAALKARVEATPTRALAA
ncbi:MAG: SRPBCC family protein [Caulobacteraceae bacterium]|nr:SRPBCC family protein [Caulobacteraceae bacterium]